ncbi:MAG: S26 family signal peptidase [Allosphingosinicella sp.]|uniref:S26 family signal peptidase n=1 Tax=Allosphingosinicella sp. TaxID=2823234 RepID=UPI00395C13B7
MRIARPLAWRTLAMASITGAALVLSTVITMPTRLVWNVTESVPLGLYAVRPIGELKVADLVVSQPPEPLAAFLADGGYLGRGAPLLKRVAALPGQTVCRVGPVVTVDGETWAVARDRDRHGRPMPVWSGCLTLAESEVLLLNWEEPASLDGRYFGPLPRSSIVGRAVPLWTDEER